MGARQLLHRYVPAHFHDPAGLAVRLMRTGNPAAHFAMGAAAAGIAAAPLDLFLSPWENRMVASAASTGRARHPLVLICGAPRTGTTVVYQTLVSHLPVRYFSNLTALFPRSPLLAERLFGRFVRPSTVKYQSYYGRTAGMAGTNDALYLWDRWLGSDRDLPPKLLTESQRRSMQGFFDAADHLFDRPLINKNNNLVLSAHLVAEALPHARFICLTRRPRDLAQSLYRARCEIHGTPDAAYGPVGPGAADAVGSVCRQVRYFDQLVDEQQRRIGVERFRVVPYEGFCRNPGELVERVAREELGDQRGARYPLPSSFAIPTGAKVSAPIADRIDSALAEVGAVRGAGV